jgi:hypothetical protein
MKAKEVIITAVCLVALVLGEFNDQDAILRGHCDKHTENKS